MGPSCTVIYMKKGISGQWPVAERGEVYLTGLPSWPVKFEVKSGEKFYEFQITIPAVTEGIPDLGEVTCTQKIEAGIK